MTSDYKAQIYPNICATTLPNKRSRTNREDNKQQSRAYILMYISFNLAHPAVYIYICCVCKHVRVYSVYKA